VEGANQNEVLYVTTYNAAVQDALATVPPLLSNHFIRTWVGVGRGGPNDRPGKKSWE
jgi:hypothetical protein